MQTTPVALLHDIVAMIEIELSYAAAEIQTAQFRDGELERAMEHIASAVTMVRKLASQINETSAEGSLCEA